jgi:drug/metabolite transporter (DMT)-like permease
METAQLGILAGITISVSFFAMIFGVFYLYKREKMAMIERGMDPRSYKPQSAPYQNLKWGLLLVGSGVGLFLAFLLDHMAFQYMGDGIFFLYLSLIAIFGGCGLFLSYRIEKKEVLDKDDHTIQK